MQPEELATYPAPLYPVPNGYIVYGSGSLVFGLLIFINVAILTFTLFNLPRAWVYIANNRSEAFQGYLLRSSTETESGLDRSIILQSKESGSLRHSIPTLGSDNPLSKQWHFPIHLSLRHPAAAILRYRVFGNYTVVQTLLMLGYAFAVFFVGFSETNIFLNSIPIGWVLASQIPFVYAFATKNNIIGLLVGVGYEKLNYLHRHVGLLMVIGANVHALGTIYKVTLLGLIPEMLAMPYIRWGLVSLAAFDILGIFSIKYIRTKSYNLFLGTHVVGLIVALFATCRHHPICISYVVAASVLYGVDHILRAIKTRITVATLRTIPEMGLTRVDIPSLKTGWVAGQHVRLRVLSTSIGLWGMTEVHPFTIASATNMEEGLVLMCKKTGNWTNKLYEMAQTAESTQRGQESVRKVRVMVEGPYGGIYNTTVPNYSGAMFIVGGSGVTFALSAVQELVLASDRSRTKVIEIVWCVGNPAALEHFLSLFAALVSHGSPAGVRVSVFYTRASTYSFGELPPGITLTPGRPNVEELLDGLVVSMMSRGGTHGAFIGVCGPTGLGKDVAHAIWNFDVDLKEAIGGIQFHDEIFDW
ncbi:hypothetical protein L210DRAFT_3099451 [Boletus edulis BED1]|uniref:ferric-chelate reductase (NADPH) n=1 Tax=Boletus edulis BED1 TaxID=1328754 RepID=A0AAD4BYY9_BOLED|nr:hypothetical protein L210DRAFT_3099451 [Boletus edulis BED1]